LQEKNRLGKPLKNSKVLPKSALIDKDMPFHLQFRGPSLTKDGKREKRQIVRYCFNPFTCYNEADLSKSDSKKLGAEYE